MEENEKRIGYRKLIAWQKADELAFQIYRLTKNFPPDEKFGLVSQMRRAALSVAANIAEGYTRNSKKDKVHFYNMALGSLTEIEYYLDFSFRLHYISNAEYQDLKKLRSEVGRLLNGLTAATRNKALVARDVLLFSLASCFLFLVPGLFFPTSFAFAATIYFNPPSGTYTVGNIFSADALLNTQGQAINNSEAVINFPTDLLEVVSVSKSGSIFSLWVEEPAFSNSAGTISFNGGLPTPGFNGTSGKIISIVFRAKNPGSASVIFSSAAVRANDGYGTDILQNRAEAQFTLVAPEAPAPQPPAPPAGAPAAPQISSPTHPDPTKWYALNNAKFTWPVPSGVTATQLLVDKNPQAVPTVLYEPAIGEKEVSDLTDGVWYFHARLRNAAGWGAVSHFRFQIDTTKPSRFEITEAKRDDPTGPKAKFIFDARDETSGIDHYEIQIDDQLLGVWRDDGSHRYETPALDPGKHVLIAKAVDKAGNSLTNSAEFTIQALKAPEITDYPTKLQIGDILIIRGETAYPKIRVIIRYQREKEEPKSSEVRADENGKFVFVADEKLQEGIYQVWAEVMDERGAKSGPSAKVAIAVRWPTLLQIGSWAVSVLAVLIPLVALILLLLYLVWYWWHKVAVLRRKVRKEAAEAETALHKAFDALREDIRKQIKMLERAKTKRELTEEEEIVIAQLKKDLEAAEKFVRKEIEDIEREVK